MVGKVLVASRSFGRIAKIGTEILEDNGLDVENIPEEDRPITEKQIQKMLSKGDVLAIVSSIEPLGSVALENVGDLKVISKHSVGLDNIDMEIATRKGVAVTNVPGTNTQAVADLTIGLMLSLSREICQASKSTKAGGWQKFIGKELWQKTVGVIGTGAIGKEVIKRLKGFNVEILAHDIVEDENFASEHGIKYVNLKELMRKSDFITLHLPLNEETEYMIGSEELKLMKSSSFLINAARGKIVDQNALYEALAEKKIAGAALDVFAEEPPEKTELLDLDNLLATPHMGAYTYESMKRMDKLCAENIIDVLEGKEPENTVNPEVFSD